MNLHIQNSGEKSGKFEKAIWGLIAMIQNRHFFQKIRVPWYKEGPQVLGWPLWPSFSLNKFRLSVLQIRFSSISAFAIVRRVRWRHAYSLSSLSIHSFPFFFIFLSFSRNRFFFVSSTIFEQNSAAFDGLGPKRSNVAGCRVWLSWSAWPARPSPIWNEGVKKNREIERQD